MSRYTLAELREIAARVTAEVRENPSPGPTLDVLYATPAPPVETCQRGHAGPWGTRRNGRRYCRPCNAARRRAARRGE